MLQFADLIDRNREKVAECETKAMGMPIAISKMLLQMTVDAFRCEFSRPFFFFCVFRAGVLIWDRLCGVDG